MGKTNISQSKIDTQNNLYIKYIIEKSRNLWDLHISESGEEVMNFVSDFLLALIPERFSIATNSYIISSSENIEEGFITSPQVDLIIYDNLVGGLNLFYDPSGKIKLIPKESVLGIFEIKRTLTSTILNTAVKQLDNIISSVQINKCNSNNYFLGGMELGDGVRSTNNQYRSNPFIGIIGLKSDNWMENKLLESYFSTDGFLDSVLCFDGNAARLSTGSANLSIANPRSDIAKYDLKLYFDKSSNDFTRDDKINYYLDKCISILGFPVNLDRFLSHLDRNKLLNNFKIDSGVFKKCIELNLFENLTVRVLIDYLITHLKNPYEIIDIFNVRINMSIIAYWLSISCGREVPVLSYLLSSVKI